MGLDAVPHQQIGDAEDDGGRQRGADEAFQGLRDLQSIASVPFSEVHDPLKGVDCRREGVWHVVKGDQWSVPID